jgi:hypothetical protein
MVFFIIFIFSQVVAGGAEGFQVGEEDEEDDDEVTEHPVSQQEMMANISQHPSASSIPSHGS